MSLPEFQQPGRTAASSKFATGIKLLLALLILGTVSSAQVVVVNNASFRVDQAVAAGSWVAAFGNFTGVQSTTAGAFPLSSSLGGVRVTVGGVEAPIYFVSETQLVFLIPVATAPGVYPVSVITAAGTLGTSVQVMSAAPGIFQKDTASPPRAAVRNQDGVTENDESAPAHPGDIIAMFGTGPGAFTSDPPDGAAPGAGFDTVSTPEVFIAGIKSEVRFSGLNAAAPGLWQLNVRIPPELSITGRVPVRVFVDGVDSNEVSIFVQ